MTERISFEDFKKVELRVAKSNSAERIEGSDKLVKFGINIGTETRTLVAGIGNAYDPASLIGKEIVVVTNLEPRSLLGIESNGMLLAADDNGPVLLIPEREVPAGAIIK